MVRVNSNILSPGNIRRLISCWLHIIYLARLTKIERRTRPHLSHMLDGVKRQLHVSYKEKVILSVHRAGLLISETKIKTLLYEDLFCRHKKRFGHKQATSVNREQTHTGLTGVKVIHV